MNFERKLLVSKGIFKCVKSLINLARPEGLEPPTTWFEATYSFAEFTAELCGFLETSVQLKSEIQGDKPQQPQHTASLNWTTVGLLLLAVACSAFALWLVSF